MACRSRSGTRITNLPSVLTRARRSSVRASASRRLHSARSLPAPSLSPTLPLSFRPSVLSPARVRVRVTPRQTRQTDGPPLDTSPVPHHPDDPAQCRRSDALSPAPLNGTSLSGEDTRLLSSRSLSDGSTRAISSRDTSRGTSAQCFAPVPLSLSLSLSLSPGTQTGSSST